MASTTIPVGSAQQSTLSDWAGPYVTNMLGKAEAISNTPYQTYQGPMTAGESDLQSKVFQGLGNLTFPSNLGQSFSSAGAYQIPSFTSGNTSPTTPGGTSTTGQPTGIAAQYMNPYLQAVLDPQLAELRRQNDITQMKTNAGLTSQGAFGGGRQAIMNAENNRNMMQEMNKTVGQGYANAYDKAMQQFNTEQGQAKTLADMLGAAGAAQRDIEQQGITADYNEFLAQRDYPMKQTQYLQSMLQGLPISTVSSTQLPQSGIGQLSSTVGGLGTLMTNLKQLGLG